MNVVFAKRTASVAMPQGYQVVVHLGTHWADNDPVVLVHPELFSPDPHYGIAGNPPEETVEAASAAPGEQRQVRRPNPGDVRGRRG